MHSGWMLRELSTIFTAAMAIGNDGFGEIDWMKDIPSKLGEMANIDGNLTSSLIEDRTGTERLLAACVCNLHGRQEFSDALSIGNIGGNGGHSRCFRGGYRIHAGLFVRRDKS